jgi:PhnB protein
LILFLLIHIMEHIVSKKISPIPRGYRTATICLTVYNVDAALAFYQAAFGAETLTRLVGADEASAIHATIKIGNSIIALNPQAPEQGVYAPMSLGVSVGQIHLYVDDVDASWERAIEAGALVHTPVYEAYWGDRTGILQDGNGHLWSIASKIENVSQDEIARRARSGFEIEAALPVDAEVPFEALLGQEALADESVAA